MATKTQEVEAKGGQSRHRSLGLTDDQALRMYEVMRLARAVDERMWLINRQGRAPFVISCQGQEGAQVGTAAALRPGHDWVAPYYRDAGVVLWFGMTARDQMLSFFARREDPNSGGRQMPGHYGSKRLHIVTGGSPVATQLLHAAGVALASKQRKEDAVTATFFGEGGASQGDCHEAMNFASIHKLAVIFVCENNGYAISVPQRPGADCWVVVMELPAGGVKEVIESFRTAQIAALGERGAAIARLGAKQSEVAPAPASALQAERWQRLGLGPDPAGDPAVREVPPRERHADRSGRAGDQ